MPIRVRLSSILGAKRIKRSELSEKTGISNFALHKLYHEQNKGIEFNTLEKLCAALECEVGDLLEYIPDESRKK